MNIIIDVTYFILRFTLISAGYCAKSVIGYYVINHGATKLMITG